MNLKDKIASVKSDVTEYAVPEWDCVLYIKKLSFGEQSKLFDYIDNEENKGKQLYVYTIIACVVDVDGNNVFTHADYDMLMSKDADVILRLGRMCSAVAKLVGDPIDEAKKN